MSDIYRWEEISKDNSGVNYQGAEPVMTCVCIGNLAGLHEIIVVQDIIVSVRVDLVDRLGSTELGLCRRLNMSAFPLRHKVD